MRITVSSSIRLSKQAQAVAEIIAQAKETASKGNTSFVFYYEKYGDNFYMNQVSSEVKEQTEGTVTGGYGCWSPSNCTYKFYIKIE